MSFEGFAALVLAVNLFCAAVCAYVATRSGRDPFSWVLAGTILGPFAVIGLFAARRNKPIPPPSRAAAPGGPRAGVLVPVDGSEPSLEAVEHVIRAPERFGEVTLLAVLAMERAEGAAAAARSPVRHEYEEDLDDHVGEAKRRLQAAGVPYTVEVRFGEPAAEILRTAAEGPFRQIVMGRRGRGGVAKLLLGSVSEQVVKNAAIPVTLAG
jgi:nucleotide-binding universal stress UspA family protein